MKITKIFKAFHKDIYKLGKPLAKIIDDELKIDYVRLQARTVEEFEEWHDEVHEHGKIIEEQSVSSAKVLHVELNNKIKSGFGLVPFIIIAEPHPNTIYKAYGIAEIGFTVIDITKTREQLAQKGFSCTEVEEVGDAQVFKTAAGDVSITIRTDSLFKAIQDRNAPTSELEKISKLEKDLLEARQRIANLEVEREAKLKLMADFQNYRKRVEQERATMALDANKMIVEDTLDVLDDVTRTIQDEQKDLARSQEMFGIIKDKLLATANNMGVEMVEIAVGDSFDSTVMEAITTVAVNDVNDHNKVVAVIQPAYKYRDKEQLLRVGKVIVGKMSKK